MNQTSKIPELIDPQANFATNGQEAWRVLGIMAEFAVATERLRGIRPAVSLFGSARIAPNHAYYQKAERIAREKREKKEILERDPFQSLDTGGVGKLVDMAVKLGRQTRKDLKCGICGEHGGDPKSIEFCHSVGLNYVSCSPFRVPIARLAAAHAAIKQGAKSK